MFSKRFPRKVKNHQKRCKVLQNQGSRGSEIHQKMSSEGILGPILERSVQVATNLEAKEHQIGAQRAKLGAAGRLGRIQEGTSTPSQQRLEPLGALLGSLGGILGAILE